MFRYNGSVGNDPYATSKEPSMTLAVSVIVIVFTVETVVSAIADHGGKDEYGFQ